MLYSEIKNMIANENIKNKYEYDELCKIDTRLPQNPKEIFKNQFDWFDYLNIEKHDYYDLETCKSKTNEYLLKHPEIKKHCLNITYICDELCKLDELFPPSGLWVEHYGVKDYSVKDLMDIIVIPIHKKLRCIL